MNYYLIFQENALQIVRPTANQEEDFKQRYASYILASGDSLAELLGNFNALPLIFGNGV